MKRVPNFPFFGSLAFFCVFLSFCPVARSQNITLKWPDPPPNQPKPATSSQPGSTSAPQPGPPMGKRPSDGSTVGNIYTNNFFQFSLQFPDGWEASSAGSPMAITNRGGAIVSGTDPVLRSAVQAAALRVYKLLVAVEGKSGGKSYSTRSISIYAVSLPASISGNAAEDFLKVVSSAFVKSGSPLQPTGEPTELSIQGKTLAREDYSGNINNNNARVSQLALVDRGYLILFTIGNPTGDESDDVVAQVMYSLHFYGTAN